MGQNRLFVSQTKLDQWLSENLVVVDGETMTTEADGNRFQLKTAVLFTEELTGTGDPNELLGRVKDLEQIATLGGEYASGSVILGENAYSVVEGFACHPILINEVSSSNARTGDSLAAAMRLATGESGRDGELDLLARFFLQSRDS
jgi:hypothetical protein